MGIKRMISAVLTAAVLLTALPTAALGTNGGTPELSALKVKTADGQELSLLEGDTAADLGSSYSFTATFEHPEQVQSVYITSTKGSAVRMLEAQWDGTAFTTSGWFGGSADYVPGKIGVQYTVKTEETHIEDPVDWGGLENSGCTAQITASSGQATRATVDLTDLLEAESQVAVDLAVDVFDETTGGNLNDWLGAYQELELLTKYTLDGGKYVLYLDYSDPSSYAMILHDVSGSKFVKTILDEAAGSSDTLRTLSEQLGNISTVSGLAHQYFTIQDSADQLREQVSGRTDLTGAEKEELRESIDDYENDRLLFTLTMTVLPAVVAASGGTMAGPALVFNALVGAINAASGFFWDNRVGMYEGCEPLDTDFTPTAHGIPLSNSDLRRMNYTLTESGTYYLVGYVSSPIRIDGANVTICKHGYGCKLINDGGSLEVRDCTYEEDLDGNMIGQSLFASVTNNGGDVSVFCGQVSVDTSGDGAVYLYEGTVSEVAAEGAGDITVYGGTVKRIENDTGDLHIQDGRVGRITNSGGRVQIDRGLIGGTNGNTVIENKAGDLIVNGGAVRGYDPADPEGSVSAAIWNGAEGHVTIYGGTLDTIRNEGDLTIWDGAFFCGQHTDGVCLTNSGTAEIHDGRFVGSISSGAKGEGGGLTIHDGTFLAAANYNVGNSWGTVVIEDGEFQMLGTYGYDVNVFTGAGNANAQLKTVIRGGTFYCEGGVCVENQRGTSLMPVPYTVIEGGSFYSTEDGSVSSSGTLTISGGTFLNGDPPAFAGGITNGGDGVLDISGGTFTCLEGGPCVYSDDNQNVTISGGTFLAPDGLSVIEGKGCTLLVGKNSDIEMSGRFGLFEAGFRTDEFQLTVGSPAGYGGGIVYYDAPEGEGTAVTPAELMAMDFSREKYLRLVGDTSLCGTSAEGVSVILSGSGEELSTATVSGPEAVLVPGVQVWAASYEDGKMTGVTSGTLEADGTVTFSKALEAGMRLFFLDGQSRPVCGSILLQPDQST